MQSTDRLRCTDTAKQRTFVEASAIRRECAVPAPSSLEDAEQSAVCYWLAGQHFLLLMMS